MISDWAHGGPDVAAQYSGNKSHLAPIRDAILTVVQGFGEDVEVAPKKT